MKEVGAVAGAGAVSAGWDSQLYCCGGFGAGIAPGICIIAGMDGKDGMEGIGGSTAGWVCIGIWDACDGIAPGNGNGKCGSDAGGCTVWGTSAGGGII